MFEIKRIELEGLVNTRDLGGFETEDGRKIRPARLIRSGELFHATVSDLHILTEKYHLKTVVDFRTQTERSGKPDPAIEGVTYVFNPILREETMGITREKENEKDSKKKKDGLAELMTFIMQDGFNVEHYMEDIYENIVTDAFVMAQYKKFFEILLSHKEGAVLWHCSAGKDRVGVATALLLSALGVPREVILDDYVKVNEYVRDKNEAMIAGMLAGVDEDKKEVLYGHLEGMFSVRRVYMEYVFKRIGEVYGSVEKCLEAGLGLDCKKVELLREMYLWQGKK